MQGDVGTKNSSRMGGGGDFGGGVGGWVLQGSLMANSTDPCLVGIPSFTSPVSMVKGEAGVMVGVWWKGEVIPGDEVKLWCCKNRSWLTEANCCLALFSLLHFPSFLSWPACSIKGKHCVWRCGRCDIL